MFGKLSRRDRARLRNRGRRATATVVEIADWGPTFEDNPRWRPWRSEGPSETTALKTTLEVHPEGEPAFELTQTIRWPVDPPEAGDRLDVLYDPEDRSKLMPAPPTPEEERARIAEALGKAGVGFKVDTRPEAAEQDRRQARAAMEHGEEMMSQYRQYMGSGSAEGMPKTADEVRAAQIEQLQGMKESGALTEEQFEAAKKQILGDG
jgi:hypothetical protein